MKNKIEAMERVLNHHISGFHQYVLDAPAHLSFVSQSFCELLGLTEDELLSDEQDRYFSRVVADDRKSYAEFLHRLSEKEQTLTLQYRILGGDGGIHAVSDTMVSERTEQGILVGSSILTDITDLKTEDPFLAHTTSFDYMNDASYGILRFTCEKHPKVTYINNYMLDILRFPKDENGETEELELYKKNIYLMIPMEERRRFSRFLDRVYHSDKPIGGSMTVQRYDGAKIRLFGWISRCVGSQGEEEFQCVCIESSERYYEKRSKEINHVKIPEQPRTRSGKKVYIRTFGYFDVFVDGAPIAFRSQKAKELFALLVDRRGGFVSSEEAIGFLWEDEPLSSVVFARYRKIALRLKNILEEYDILDIIEVSDGKRRLIVEKTGCDYYDYLSGKEEYATLFKGSYLMNYSWGERTLGELMSE